jgi:transposase
MGSEPQKAAAVNLLCELNTHWRDTVSKKTTATTTLEITSTTPTLMLALELGEEKWKLGFSSAFGQIPLERNIASRSTKALLAQISWATKKLGLQADARVVSCYGAGLVGFWLHRFLVAHGVESLIVDSSSIEVPQKSRRAKTDRLDLAGLCDLLARHVAGSAKPVWSVVRVPSIEEEDRRHLHRELKTAKHDRTRVSNRIKSLLANNGLTLSGWKELGARLARLRLWDGNRLPASLRARLERYASDYAFYTDRIRGSSKRRGVA